MPAINDICSTCGAYGPVAALATLRDGDHLALCPACGVHPERLRAFIARYNAARHDHHAAAGRGYHPRVGQPQPAECRASPPLATRDRQPAAQ